MKNAVIILSGGLDSTTCMGLAQEAGFDLYPITFNYGQRHLVELDCARRVAHHYGVSAQHRIVNLDFLKQFGGSALTDEHAEIPDFDEQSTDAEREANIPVTYVPGRNMLFLAITASYAEVIGAEVIYMGVNALDYSGYPDCRPDFIAQMQEAIRLGTKAGAEGTSIRIETPLIHWSKKEIIEHGLRLQVPYEQSTSCYNGQIPACGRCDSCRLRLKGFAEAGKTDPIAYES